MHSYRRRPSVRGDPNVIIAIVDTGVNLSHPDLTLVTGWDFGDNDSKGFPCLPEVAEIVLYNASGFVAYFS